VGEPSTILVADDSRLVRSVMARALTAQGYRVLTAEDGVATVELAWSERPSLVLLDVEMPRMSGYQVTRLLRSEPRTADIPIVMFSSREAAGDVFWGMEAGADAYVAKSAGEADILATVARVLAARGQAAPRDEPVENGAPDRQLDVLARVNDLLDRKLYEATVLNQLGQLSAELRDYRRAAERAGGLLVRLLDYQVAGLLFLHAEPAEGLVLVRGRSPTYARMVAHHLLTPLPAEVQADLPPTAALPLVTVQVDGTDTEPEEPGPWRGFALGDASGLWGSFCLAGRDAAEDRAESRELIQALASHLFMALDNARMYTRLRETAITDALTGLFNRRYFADQFARHCQRAERGSRPLSLILFDVDHFKRVNDTLGHLAGDAALRELGGALRDSVRPSDFVARYGGEEFAVVLPETELILAERIAERLRKTLAQRWSQAGLGDLTASAGVASAPDSAPYDPERLLAAADRALYAAKAAGRNRSLSSRGGLTLPG
jgi:two-component system cell cycle response regulator